MPINPKPFSPVFQFPPSGRPPAPKGPSVTEPPPPLPPPTSDNCPPGYYWDAVLGECVSLTSPGSCPPGYVYDPNSGECMPIPGGPTMGGNFPGPGGSGNPGGGAGTSGDTGSEGPIYVNVNNTVKVADDSANAAVRAVAGAVSEGIASAAQAASQIEQNTAQTIGNQISAVTTGIGTVVQNDQVALQDVIGNINSDVTSTLGTLGSTVATGLFNTLNPIETGLAGIITIISQQIGGLAGAIGQAVAAVIPAIVLAVTGAISPSQAVLQSILGEITTSTTNLATIGSDISGGFANLDATLLRLLQSWELYNTGFVESQTGYGDGSTLHSDLSSLWQALAGLVTTLAGKVTFTPTDSLTPPCDSTVIQQLLHTDFNSDDIQNTVWGPLLAGAAKLIIWFVKIAPALEKVVELVRQDVNLECPNDLLTPAALVQAVQRGFITDAAGAQEAARGDLNIQRWQILKDLAVHQMSPGELVEAQYRGYINQTDFTAALAAQGWTAGQQQVLQGLAVPQIRPATYNSLNELLQRGIIDGNAFDKVLQGLNFDDGQRKAMAELVFRPIFLNEEIEGLASEDLWGGLNVGGLGQSPESVQTAGAAEGFSADTVNRRWLAHWQTGGENLWMDLYFRGAVSYQQLQAVLRRQFIPDQLHPLIVAGSRPLVQFRTISRMVFLNLLTPAQGKAYLLQHGYSDSDADLLITYAVNSGKSSAAHKAQQQHAVSVGIAKEEYIEGSISADQFFQVLIAHQFTPDGANTEIATIDAHQAMVARRNAAQFVVDQYGAGLIDEQVALAELATIGLTAAEFAKWTHKIRAFRVKNAKLPSAAELLKFAQAQIITWDQYVQGLIAQGYTPQAAQWFLKLNQNAPTNTPPAPANAAPAA